jgi:hypothetical protein
MTEYHTTNIQKEKYNQIQNYAQTETIFANTKNFILHAVAQTMTPQGQQDLGMQALQKLDNSQDIDSKKIREALADVAVEKLEEKES